VHSVTVDGMAKKVTAPRKPGLHFEKISVAEVAKKIGPGNAAKVRRNGMDDLTAEPGPRPRPRSSHFHGVQFYNDPDALCRIVGSFVGEGLERTDLALLIVTPDHAERIDRCLRARGTNLDDARRDGRLVTVDAEATLQLFMADGLPNPGAFRQTIGSVLTELRRGRERCTVRAYGEMVDLLWKDGREAAAIRLETLWNQLAVTHDFDLLCGYSIGNFYKGAGIEDICNQHSHLLADTGDATALPDRRAESAALL
jgi:hypothetical protein